jgi:hypothetical protein
MSQRLRIGCGAGFANDRTDAAVILVEHGRLDFLVLECLAERTIALGQRRELAAPGTGYDPSLERRIRSLLKPLAAAGTRLIANLGAANPLAAGAQVKRIAEQMGIPVRIAVLTGDDVLPGLSPLATAWEDGRPLAEHGPIVSANAYLGTEALLPALDTGADIVLTGRVADPSLFLAPMVAEFGWDSTDWQRLAAGTLVGHLLECGAQVSGGYFVDPPYKTVDDLAHVGFPIAEVGSDGAAVVTKVPGTGGMVNFETVSEQLTYEILDPANYVTPDVTVDISEARIDEVGVDRVAVHGAAGKPRPDRLKASVGYRAGHLCEAEISYAGTGSVARAEAAAEVVRQRLAGYQQLRLELIGVNALHGGQLSAGREPYECRLRLSALCSSPDDARLAGEEVVGLYNNGPAGGGGCRSHVTELIGILSTDIARETVKPEVTLVEVTV